jgi:hypothetical protein
LDAVTRKLAQQQDNKTVTVFLLVYGLLAHAALAPFDCVKTEEDDAAHDEPATFMRDNPSSRCDIYDEDGIPILVGAPPPLKIVLATGNSSTIGQSFDPTRTFLAFTVLGTIVLVACCLPIVIIAIQLRCARPRLYKDERIMREYAMLYLRYEKACYYWEVLILVRKLLFVVIPRVYSNDQVVQIGSIAVVLGGALVLQHRCKPFLSDALDQLEEYTLLACMGLVMLGVGSYLGMPPLATTVLYFVLMVTASVFITKALRAVWREDTEETEGSIAIAEMQERRMQERTKEVIRTKGRVVI